jgi:predicted nucleic acid-binding protein
VGIILDMSVLIAYERRRSSIEELVADMALACPHQSISVSVMSIIELTPDLIIGATALQSDDAVPTHIQRHFAENPGLTVLPL